jgi:hypothetical protein
MILLDTDVVSAIMRLEREPAVLAWLNRQERGTLHLTAISVFEVGSGIERLEVGRKRQALADAFRQALSALGGDVIPFDEMAARASSQLYGERWRRGTAIGMGDTQIAGIVLARNAILATRNTRHFADTNIPLINPWETA